MNVKNQIMQPIGVFDSGLGGLSVLQKIYQLMPNEHYIFYGDSANAPYGTKDTEEVYQLSKRIVDMFITKYHVKAIVIACNTATSAAAKRLRSEYSLPIIGIEPAIKPAIENHPNGKILAMATPLTLSGDKFNQIVQKYGSTAEVVKVPAPKLVEFVERGELNSDALKRYLHDILDDKLPADSIVLGCTHFPFVRGAIQEVAPNTEIIDGSLGTARYLKKQLKNNLNPKGVRGEIKFYNSDPAPSRIALCEKLFKIQ